MASPRLIVALILTTLGHASAEGPKTNAGPASPKIWDTYSDTWVATDGLGRSLPLHEQVGSPRKGKSVAIFYFLWHGAHVNGGPYDITKILAQNPEAMSKKDSPLWGPMHAPHHWGESLFGYYLTDDEYVLRKHAQMLSNAGIDAIIFDVSNQVTYKRYYMTLLKIFSEVQRAGNRAPQVAFLCPFWDPAKVVAELYRDLYEPGLYADLWFRWDGKPLILADPSLIGQQSGNDQQNDPVALSTGHALGQTFTAPAALEAVGARCPTWRGTDSAVTLTLRRGSGGKVIVSRRFENVTDNAWLMLDAPEPLPPGDYYLEMTDPKNKVGWWSHTDDVLKGGQAFVDGQPVSGDRTLRCALIDEQTARLRDCFTFRAPQPDYFKGPTQPDMWSWLEVYPQHVFKNAGGEKEQMSVGVAQNAVSNRLGSMSEKGARGRSFHEGRTPADPDAVNYGYNFAEQWEHALQEDPTAIFITGWNEWIAGRFDAFAGVREPVMFVDQFDQEHSRDVEPMRGGHGDNYYYQMVSYVRRFKGARPLPPITPRPIVIDGRFDDWHAVEPEFRDTIGDPARRHHPGWNNVATYTNDTGRNDIVVSKVSYDDRNVYFYVRTRQPLTPSTDANWMLLFIDVDHDPSSGWLGYDRVVNRLRPGDDSTFMERNVDNRYHWDWAEEIRYTRAGTELEIAIPRDSLKITKLPTAIDFKWADNIQQTGHWSDFTLNGDSAPNDRFNYRSQLEPSARPSGQP